MSLKERGNDIKAAEGPGWTGWNKHRPEQGRMSAGATQVSMTAWRPRVSLKFRNARK